LIDVMGNMSFLLIEPMLEKHFYTVGIFKRIGPGRFRETYEKFISHFPEAAHNFKCFARALVEVAQCIGPPDRVQSGESGAGFGNEGAALHVTARLAISKMMNDFVNAPAVRGRTVEPHLLGKLPKRGSKQSGTPSKRLELLPAIVDRHAPPSRRYL
jgi:hypothetical protein